MYVVLWCHVIGSGGKNWSYLNFLKRSVWLLVEWGQKDKRYMLGDCKVLIGDDNKWTEMTEKIGNISSIDIFQHVCLGSNQTQGFYARQNSIIGLEYTQACLYSS